MAASPIADLSYRNYDGPLLPPTTRWWAIARVAILAAFKKKSFWVMTAFSGFWYVILMIVFYFADMNASQMVAGQGRNHLDPDQASKALFAQVNWHELFLNSFGHAQLWYFLIALLIGVGTIANDSRANALLVYLSKPCTKLDYVIGKWLGIFVPLVVAAAIPTFFFYGYCLMSYRSSGFLHDPWLFFKLILMILLPAVLHASLSLGISSMFKQGRIAGATYAGLFFFSYFLTISMGFVHFQLAQRGSPAPLVDTLYYCSVDGIQIGLAKSILGTSGTQPVPFMNGMRGSANALAAVPAPNGFLFTLILFFVIGVSILFAWSRVRAVEVVG